MDTRRSIPYEEYLDIRLQNKVEAELYLETFIEEGEPSLFLMALEDLARARIGSIDTLTAKTGLDRGQLGKVLSSKGAKRREGIDSIRGALGLGIAKDHTVMEHAGCGQQLAQ